MNKRDCSEALSEITRARPVHWGCALTLALMAHVAVGLGLSYQSARKTEVAAGAPMVIEIAEFAAAPATAASTPAHPEDETPQPELEETEVEPQLAEEPQLTEIKEPTTIPEPQLEPNPADLPKPQLVKKIEPEVKPKPKEELKEVAQKSSSEKKTKPKPKEDIAPQPQEESIAMPSAEKTSMAVQATQSQANDAQIVSRKRASWEGRLAAHLERFKRYPYMARSRREEGIVMLRFTMDRQGEIIESYLEEGSGSFLLDREVKDMLRRAKPLPPPPREIAGNTVELLLPIEFALR